MTMFSNILSSHMTESFIARKSPDRKFYCNACHVLLSKNLKLLTLTVKLTSFRILSQLMFTNFTIAKTKEMRE